MATPTQTTSSYNLNSRDLHLLGLTSPLAAEDGREVAAEDQSKVWLEEVGVVTVREAIPLVGSIVEELKSRRGGGGRVGGGRKEEVIEELVPSGEEIVFNEVEVLYRGVLSS